MRTKNAKPISADDAAHLAAVKAQPCSQCNAKAPSEAHHIKQGRHRTTVAWCFDCHRGPHGWHGDKQLSKQYAMDEIDCLNVTHKRLGGDYSIEHTRTRKSKIQVRSPKSGELPMIVPRPYA